MYQSLTDEQARERIRAIISDSSSEGEVDRRLEEELGLTGVSLSIHLPVDAAGREARSIVSALDGLVMKDGAMAMFMAYGPSGKTISG